MEIDRNLSPLIADFADRLGLDNALKIVEAYRNKLLYVPMRGASPQMVDRLGQDLADRLVQEYRGCQWRVPCASSFDRQKRNALIRLRRSEGKRQSAIAIEFNLTYGQIGYILRTAPPPDLMPDRSNDVF
jgi:hypothetical protein